MSLCYTCRAPTSRDARWCTGCLQLRSVRAEHRRAERALVMSVYAADDVVPPPDPVAALDEQIDRLERQQRAIERKLWELQGERALAVSRRR